MGGALAPEVIDHSEHQLIRDAEREVRELLNWSGSKPNWQAVIRWKHAMPQYTLGHVDRMNQLQSTLDNEPTLKLCGAAYRGVGIPQCVKSGRQAAQELIEHFAEE